MDHRHWWIALNAINCLATLGGLVLSSRRLRRATLARSRFHALESVRLMCERNVAIAQEQIVVNALLCALGLYLIVVALIWRGRVPLFVDTGTGGFAFIWLLWTWREWWDARRMARIADVAEREHRGIPGESTADDDQSAPPGRHLPGDRLRYSCLYLRE